MTTNGSYEFELPRLPEPDPAPDGGAPAEHRPDDRASFDPEPAAAPSAWADIRDTRRVVLRVHGAEEIELGCVDGREPAVRLAREMIGAIEEAQARGEWPLVEDRFIRPGAIVSVDVQRAA
jgi:hypothetical protein